MVEQQAGAGTCRGIMEKKMDTIVIGFRVHWGFLGIVEKKTGTTIVYWDYLGIMERKTET